jgi:hypothetical protein
MTKLFLSFATAALAIAGAASSHTFHMYQPATLAGTELKVGDYKIDVKDNKAVITRGKNSIEAQVKVETVPEKIASTSIRYENTDGKLRIQEIRLGGTNTKLVFNN